MDRSEVKPASSSRPSSRYGQSASRWPCHRHSAADTPTTRPLPRRAEHVTRDGGPILAGAGTSSGRAEEGPTRPCTSHATLAPVVSRVFLSPSFPSRWTSSSRSPWVGQCRSGAAVPDISRMRLPGAPWLASWSDHALAVGICCADATTRVRVRGSVGIRWWGSLFLVLRLL